jgi:hypothetical protein
MQKVLAVLCVSLAACQPTNGPRPEPAPAFSIDRLEVRGECNATIELDVRAGFVAVPVLAVVSTSAVGAHTRGGASVDVGGLVTARCDIDSDKGSRCAQGGLLLRGAGVDATPSPDATPAD